jgi:4-amino-4-deoxy-L-arabinose transferase-like glycosyltransferase
MDEQQKTLRANWVWIVVSVIILLTALIRFRLLDVPLERDEGEYAYAGQLILQGVPPYKLAYNMKLPGIYAAYAVILAVFGQTQSGIHLGLLVINAAAILLIFLLARRLFGPVVGLAAAAVFALLSISQKVYGIFANAEHFVILPALAGILLLLQAIDSRKRRTLFTAGLLLGIGLVIKQHGAAFILFAVFYLLYCELNRRPIELRSLITRSVVLLLGVALPFGVTCLVLWQAGVFDKFWLWTFDYARSYVSHKSLSAGYYTLKTELPPIVASAGVMWLLAFFGLIWLVRDKTARPHVPFIVGLLLFSFLGICPGFYFRPHYFIFLLPAVAILSGFGFTYICDLLSRKQSGKVRAAVALTLAVVIFGYTVYQQRVFLFCKDPMRASRMTYGPSPFPESLEIAHFIREQSDINDTIAVIGSEPQIYFYANRRSATGHIYMYALMENHDLAREMQQEMFREIESARPKFLVFVHIIYSWMADNGSDRPIVEWFGRYSQQYYNRVGAIDIISPDKTVYRWGQDAVKYVPQSECWIAVYQRKS